ncbi:TPA: spore coat protein U domain-containing protein [Salmonella enterica subsp. enterica serovar Muenchen]
MNIIKSMLFLFLFIIMVSHTANGAYQNFLWVPMVPVRNSFANPVTVDDVGYSNISITFPVVRSWRVISTGCSGYWNGFARGNYRFWLQYRNGWQNADGLRYRFRDIKNWNISHSTPVSGVITMVSPINYKNQQISTCWELGDNVGFITDIPAPIFRAVIELDRSVAVPGMYNLKIPYWWAYEENKASGDDASVPWRNFGIMMNKEEPSYITLPVTVISKCSFNSSPINLSHGAMSGIYANGSQTRTYQLNISCNSGTSVSIKLLGSNPVSGKSRNYTRCGFGGVCELTFNDGKYDEVMNIDGSKVLSIKSTYYFNDLSNIVAEKFEGSGILQVLIN